MNSTANLIPWSFASHVKKLKPRSFKSLVIIALVVGKIKRILMYNLSLEFAITILEGHFAGIVPPSRSIIH
jgi:hypothetical protein